MIHSQAQINIGYKDTNFTPNGLYRFDVDTNKIEKEKGEFTERHRQRQRERDHDVSWIAFVI